MTTEELKNNFINISAEVKNLAENFSRLSYNQINWKPSDSQWSIGECIEHLIRTNVKYIPAYEKFNSAGGGNKNLEFKHTLTGKFVLKSIMPDNRKKYKTSSSFDPAGSKIKETIVKDFLEQNNKILELSKKIDSSNLKEKISSPFNKLIKYSIGDSLLIIANHNLRHLRQAKRVMQNENFPQFVKNP